MAPDFPASHALRGEPVIAENLPANEQFEMPWPLEQAVASVADVVIGSDDKPFGILQAASPEVSRRFTGDDLGFLQICAELVAAAVARLEVTQSLEHTVEEKTAAVEEEEIILRELQHRIKNNFQDVLSLIHLQRRNALTGEARRQLDVLRARLQALSAVHDQVCPENAVASLKAYIQQICSNLRTFVQAEGIELDCRIDEIAVQPKTARYLGLVVNEFVTNSFEHAFPEGQGTVLVVLEPIEPDRARLTLADNGIGMPPELERCSGLGMQLITTFAQQIGAEIEWDHADGTRAMLVFPPLVHRSCNVPAAGLELKDTQFVVDELVQYATARPRG